MNLSFEILVQLALAIPLCVAAGLLLSHRHPNIRESITLIGSGLLLAVVLSIYQGFDAEQGSRFIWLAFLPGLELTFELEALSMVFAIVAAGLWFITSIYAIGYVRGNKEHHQTRFYLFFAIAIAGAMGVAFAGNLITLFVFYEALTLSTFPLVTHKGTQHSMKAGRVYLGVLLTTSICLLLPAIIWVWHVTGTTDFRAGGILVGHLEGWPLTVLALMFVLGIGKAAVMPVHRWLPAAMVAPTPVSALLHAVAVVKAGVFSVVKVMVYIFGIEHLSQAPFVDGLLYLACFTVITASLIALYQDNLKRRLAYSTISQLSYVVMGALLLAPLSMLAAGLHIVAHAVGKITLFFAAGSIYTASHKTQISQLDGIGRRMPWTMTAFTIGALSMIGVPPAVGFISKWYLVMGAMQAEQTVALIVIIASTLLNAAYFIPIIYRAFFKVAPASSVDHGEAPWPIVLALTLTATLTIGLFFYPQFAFELVQQMGVTQ